MSINIRLAILFLFIASTQISCKQSAPSDLDKVEVGDLYFSGYYWNYKDAATPVGPGPNRFSGNADNAWVDSLGYLHLKISKKNDLWYCAELISTKEFGYGTYVFTCESDIRVFDKYAVFGFFTWNNYSFQTDGNSEVDIEFAKWGTATDTLLTTYSVQPVIFSNPSPYSERTHKPTIPTSSITGTKTYMFTWTPDSIVWKSFQGANYIGATQLSHWSFDKNNIQRSKIENSLTSNPFVIPTPGDSTNIRFNLWLLNGQAPSNGLNHEVVISSFKYIPL